MDTKDFNVVTKNDEFQFAAPSGEFSQSPFEMQCTLH